MGGDGTVGVRPLYYVGMPTEEQRLALRAGKDSLGVDWMVQPIQLTPANAADVPDDAAVLAFDEPDFYIRLYAKLTPPYTVARMASALRELYGLSEPVHLTTGDEWLGRFLPGIRFLEEVEL